MNRSKIIFLGIDCGATTSKFGGVDASGQPISLELRQSSTRSTEGAQAMIDGWMQGAEDFLSAHHLTWDHVAGVGLAMPGPYLSYGVLGKLPNMPASLKGWHFLDDLTAAIAQAAGRAIRTTTGNDGQLAGLAEARRVQAQSSGSVLMLSPGSGLGCSFVEADGRTLSGDHQAAAILCHMPLPYRLLGLPRFECGCGLDWGCIESYTSISGLPQMIEHLLPQYPDHPLAHSQASPKEKALSLRGRAQKDDPLALEIFDLQAKALGLAVAISCRAYDPTHIIIGGGLIDPDATTPAFRQRYLDQVKATAGDYLWGDPSALSYSIAQLGELSQAIGAALQSADTGESVEPGAVQKLESY